MSTGQKYSGKGNNVSPTPQTAPIAAPTTSTSDNRSIQPISPLIQSFITSNQDIARQHLDEIEVLLAKRFAQAQIRYTNVLDGLALIRAFTPTLGIVNGDNVFIESDCHYALLINKKGCFDSLILLLEETEETEPDLTVDYLSATKLPIPYLLKVLADNDINTVLIASSRNDGNSLELFTDDDRRYANDLCWETLDKNGIKMIDWLVVSPDGNGSLEEQNDSWIGRERSKEGVDWYTLMTYGTQPVQP